MKKTIRFLVSVLIITFLSDFAGALPPSHSQLVYRLLSPDYLAGGLQVTNGENAFSASMNPALPASFQRVVLETSYVYLHNFPTGKQGHVLNVAGVIPSKKGVYSAGLSYMDTSQLSEAGLDIGNLGRFSLAFSKKIYSDIWFGFGVDGGFGSLDNQFQFGAGLNLGFIHFPEYFGGLKNFRWGGSIHGLGYYPGSDSRGYLNAVPSNLTPATGLAFDIVNASDFIWTLRGDLRLPSVTDISFSVANELLFSNLLTLKISSSITLRDALTGAAETLIPSVKIGLNFSFESRRSSKSLETTEMKVGLAAAPLYNNTWAFSGGVVLPLGLRDENPPVVSGVTLEEEYYISPDYDGEKDELLLPYTVEDERYITAYNWRVENSSGDVIKTFMNKDERPENETAGNLWKRLFAETVGISLPEAFRWDGLGDSGAMVDDGKYRVYMSFTDDNGNMEEVGPISLVLDTQDPELDVKIPEGIDLIFSPDGDGIKDEFPLNQSGSRERLWTAEIQDASGNVVYSRSWDEAPPESWKWDGRSSMRELVPDSVYTYLVRAEDLAGNKTSEKINNIVIDTRQPEVGLSIDRNIFSPGTGNRFDTISFEPDVSSGGAVVKWSLNIVNHADETLKHFGRQTKIPGKIAFDGRTDSGDYLPEGAYRGVLTVNYRNGFQPSVESPTFLVDLTKPVSEVKANWNVFSPQGDSRRSTVSFSQNASEEEVWQGVIRDSKEREVKVWEWSGKPQSTLVWDGRDSEGRIVEDGDYTYSLRSVDTAGNSGVGIPIAVSVDTSTVQAGLSVSLDAFSPDGNGEKDSLRFYVSVREDSPVSEWFLEVRDASNRVVREWKDKGTPPDNIEWNGRSSARKDLLDGIYNAALRVFYEKGDVADAVVDRVILDTEAPGITLSAPRSLFSPDGDGSVDVFEFNQKSSGEGRFESSIKNAKGEVVWNRVWDDELTDWSWDGRDNLGNTLPDGVYLYEILSSDEAGNSSSRSINAITIDTVATPLYLTASKLYIRAGERDQQKKQAFSAIIPNEKGIENWEFSIEDSEGGASVYAESGNGRPPKTFSWDGVGEKGKALEGRFAGVLNVYYSKGARPEARSGDFISDDSPPEVEVVVAPKPFSPDDDGLDDEATITMNVQDASGVKDWELDIDDPRGRKFISYQGSGQPSERIIWDGRSSSGELVGSAEDYPYSLRVTDLLGNVTLEKGTIPVDVLVIREGNRLKILINNVTFEPNSPTLTAVGEKGQKNTQVLDRLGQIMAKYRSYGITVEGHAASLKWANPAEAEKEQQNILIPLSQKRALTVVQELIRRGVDGRRLTAEGIGGARPVVPHSNVGERWRNRRVEFYLEK